MSEDYRKEFEDDRPFWELPTVDHDLRKISKADKPIIRKYTINPRMPIEEGKFLQIVENIELDSVVDNITFENPNKEIEWKGEVRKRNTKINITARAIMTAMKTVINSEINHMVGFEKEKTRQKKMARLVKERKGAVLENST